MLRRPRSIAIPFAARAIVCARAIAWVCAPIPATACGREPSPPAIAAEGITRDEWVRVEIESECARLRAGATLDRLDEFREATLTRLGKTRLDRALALDRFGNDAEAIRSIAAEVAECRRVTGWTAETGPEGNPTWVRSNR